MIDLSLLLVAVVLFGLIALGIPIAYALFVSGFLGILMQLPLSQTVSLLWNTLYAGSQSFTFATIPMFVLMALILNETDLLKYVFGAIDKWTRGVVPGGLAIGTTFTNGIFAALSGSTVAASAAIAKIAKPELDKYDYDDRLSLGTIAASGTFAQMFPPSLGLIVFGLITGTSIGELFIGGIVPGLLTVGVYVLVILVWASYNPSIAGKSQEEMACSWTERFQASAKVWPAVLLIVLVLGSLYTGVVTATEAGALGAFGALLIGVSLYRVRWGKLNNALTETANITAYIFVLLIAAQFFSRWVAMTGIVDDLLQFLTELPIGDLGVLLIILGLYLLLGMFMNQIPILVLTLPVTFPLVVEGFGYPPIWFGIVIIKTVEIGMVTPPIGINVYVASKAVDVDPSVTFRGVARFISADVITLLLLIALPEIATYLPNTMG